VAVRRAKNPKTKTKGHTLPKRRGRRAKKASISGNIPIIYEKDAIGDRYTATVNINGKDLAIDLIGFNQENIEKLDITSHGGFIMISEKEKDRDVGEVLIAIRDTDLPRDSRSHLKISRSSSSPDDYDVRFKLNNNDKFDLIESTGEVAFALGNNDKERDD